MADQDPERKDLREQYAAMDNRLAGIIVDAPTYTAAQMQAALVDIARIQRRTLRVLAYFVGLK